ncbi:putative bypass of stop codon protein [Clavispora lusitaniae]|nr:putative bypass of stop codon protein [Clavispora lusitaniae]QFZ36752.1 putative bypass of stop codon protein [Clavispora lusitaniae]QFZ42436.1 putative bypass of stop codon protein [Clavispora lusitaniae]QFZ48112.1 putative bypass of stop codon protein [Clavispora lusitaniae]
MLEEKLATEPSLGKKKPSKFSTATDPIWTILPSYDMYQATFHGDDEPPQYAGVSSASEVDTQTSTSEPPTLNTDFSSVPSENRLTVSTSQDTSLIIADESTTSWRETILDNIHNLRNLTFSDNKCAQALTISVHYTEDVGEIGKVPKHIDPSNFEYKQGDYLNGYVLIRNDGPDPIPFDMFYVLFEGNFIVRDITNPTATKPIKVRKFLEMYDFAASYNRANVNRLLKEHEGHWYCCSDLKDPIDGTHSSLGEKQQVLPGITYKRFFTFKIPVRLLDTECNDHKLAGHTELPPTLGMPPLQKKSIPKEKHVSDLTMIDASTSYGVMARFIGKASKYNVDDDKDTGTKLINAKGDEFIILKESISHVRILQESILLSDAEKAANKEASRLLYHNFLKRVQEKIEIGTELKKAIEEENNPKALDLAHRLEVEKRVRERSLNDNVKFSQLYTSSCHRRDSKDALRKAETYDIMLPIQKKSLFSSKKMEGTLVVSTPKTEFLMDYVPPKFFREGLPPDDSSWKFQVLIEVKFTPSGLQKKEINVPEIKSVRAEFVVFTVKSNKRPIPVELNHNFLFSNDYVVRGISPHEDNFTHLVKKPVQTLAGKMYTLIRELGSENFQVEHDLVADLSALANMEEKYNNLVLHDTKLQHQGQIAPAERGIAGVWEKDGQSFKKSFSVHLDITKAQKKAPNSPKLHPDYKVYDEVCFVPSFQTCLLSRMYYIKLLISFSNDQFVSLKVPASIAKMPS